MTHVVDACALIAYLKQENGHQRFAEILLDDQNVLAMHTVNLCEVYYNYMRSDGHAAADAAWVRASEILRLVNTLDEQFVKRVARWKTEYELPLGDAFAAATAEEHGCAVLTADHNDFGRIEEAHAIAIVWLR